MLHTASSMLSGTMARIIISLFQVLRPLGDVFDITYPKIYRNLLVDIGVLELDFLSVNVTPLGCSIELTFHHKLYSRTLVPLAVLLALYLFARFCSRVAQRLRDKEGAAKGSRDWEAARKWEGFGSSAIALALFLIF